MATPRLSGQEYLQQIRSRRQSGRDAAPAESATVATQEAASPPQPPIAAPEQFESSEFETNFSSQSANQAGYFPSSVPKPLPEELVFEWQAANRPFKKRDRQFYVTITTIVFLISLILFFAGQFLPIAVVVAGAFLLYVLSSIPPDTAITRITTYGVRVDDQIYYWEELGRFWFSDKYGEKVLHIEVARFPNRLTFLLGEVPPDLMTEILSEVLLQETPIPTFMDKATEWLQRAIPLERGPESAQS